MLSVRQIKDNKCINETLVQKFCQYEKERLLNIIPDKVFFYYAVNYENNKYKVVCSYRNIILFKYYIFTLDDLTELDEPKIQLIYKILCTIICNTLINTTISNKEEDFLIYILNKYINNDCTYLIYKNFKYLPEKVQKHIKYILSYL